MEHLAGHLDSEVSVLSMWDNSILIHKELIIGDCKDHF